MVVVVVGAVVVDGDATAIAAAPIDTARTSIAITAINERRRLPTHA